MSVWRLGSGGFLMSELWREVVTRMLAKSGYVRHTLGLPRVGAITPTAHDIGGRRSAMESRSGFQ